MPDVGCGKNGKDAGTVTSLSLQGFQVAYVVFQKPSGVSAAIALKGPLLVSTESHPVQSGIHSQYCRRCGRLCPGPWAGGEAAWGSVCCVHGP